jgi:alpha-tubulin suppressor-like RCC1 family protein/formylglycine-generating enzyme required for sulfatase activity
MVLPSEPIIATVYPGNNQLNPIFFPPVYSRGSSVIAYSARYSSDNINYTDINTLTNSVNNNSANFSNGASWGGLNGAVTTVGTNGGPSSYGTYDQAGNVWNWNDYDSAIIFPFRGIRGGAFNDFYTSTSSSSNSSGLTTDTKTATVGLRVASSFSSVNPLNLSDFVTIGDINNTADTATSYGSVAYSYAIGKYVVTNIEYVQFLNAVAVTDSNGVYNANMSSSTGGIIRSGTAISGYSYATKNINYDRKPVVWISWFDCARYCNWLHNGKPTGVQDARTTEDGAYTLNGAISGNAVARNSGAKYHIPTENEWYKAAYYKGGGTNAGYWKYATQSNIDPIYVMANSTGDGVKSLKGTITGLINGTPYSVIIAARNSNGTGPGSLYYPATPATVPSAATALTATPGNNSCYLTWTTPSSNGGATITSYVLQYTTDYSLTDAAANWITSSSALYNTTNNSGIISGLSNGIGYKFRVAAVNSAGTGTFSSGSNVILPASDSQTNAGPKINSAISGNGSILVNYSAPSATWTSSVNEKLMDYVVAYSTDLVNFVQSSDTSLESVSAATRNVTITGLTNSTTYYIRIGWRNYLGMIIYSNQITSTPAETAVLSNAPTFSSSIVSGNESVILSNFTSSDGLDTTSYTTQISSDKINWTNITSSDPSDTNTASNVIGQNITSLNNNTSIYYFRIKNNRSYSTGWSPIFTMGNSSLDIANAKLNLNLNTTTAPRVTSKTYNGTVSTVLSWSAPTNIPAGETIQYYSIDMKPTGVSLINSLASYYAGGSYHGQGSSAQSTTNPVLIMNNSNILKLQSGAIHSLVIDSDGKLYGWGSNNYGSLGGLAGTYNYVPIILSAETNWTDIDCGNYCSYAINSSGMLYSFGYNVYGGLGDGTTNDKSTITRVGSATNWVSVSSSYYSGHFINSLGELYAAGYNNNGQLGDASTANKSVLTRIGSATNWTKVSCGGYSTYAINSAGQLYGWGNNSYGQLGDGTTTTRLSPVKIGNANNWVDVSAGTYWVHAINSAGEMYGIGYNAQSQLADGTVAQRNSLTRIGSATNWQKVINSGNNSENSVLAIDTSGKLFVWGGTSTFGLASAPIVPTAVPVFAPYKVTNVSKLNSSGMFVTISMSSADYASAYSTTATSQTLPYAEAGKFFTIRAVFTNGNISPRSNLKI